MAREDLQRHGLNASVLRTAGVVGFATLCSRILGLVREQVFAVLFGAGNLTDAFNVAFRIPNLLRNLFAEGAMSSALVPTFTRARKERGEAAAWRIAGLVFRVLTLIVGLLAVLGIYYAPELVNLYASAFKLVPGKYELTVRMTRILFPFFPMVALAAALMGVLNACGVFFVPAFSSALFNLASISVGVGVAEVFFKHGAEWDFFPIEGMAIGVLAGGLVQVLSQLPSLYRVGYRWRKRLTAEPVWYRDPDLRLMLALMLPGVFGLAVTQISVLVNTLLATTQGPGAVSWLNYAFRLMQFPIGLFGVSMASAVLPQVARQWVERDVKGVEGTLSLSLKQVFAINLPASAGLAFLGYPIIEMIFQYGRFTSEDTRATALALAMYSIGLTAYSAVKVLVPAFYALGNARVPVVASGCSVMAAIVMNLLFVRMFGYWGLALATSLAALLNLGFLLVAMKSLLEKAGGSFPIAPIAQSFFKNLCVALSMGLAVYAAHRLFNFWLPDRILAESLGKLGLVLSRLLKLGLVIPFGFGWVLGFSKLLRIHDVAEAVDIFAKKLKNKLSHTKT